jgi:hypothetical protein
MKDETRNPLLVACPRLPLGVLPFYQELRQKANPGFIHTLLGGSLGLISVLGQASHAAWHSDAAGCRCYGVAK